MKLKQRIVLMSIIFTWFLLSLSFIIYHYVQTFQSSVTFLSTDTASKVENMKLRLAQKDLMRAHTRRLKKESRLTLNSSMNDSNKAAEVELNDTEYEDILNKWGSFVQWVFPVFIKLCDIEINWDLCTMNPSYCVKNIFQLW